MIEKREHMKNLFKLTVFLFFLILISCQENRFATKEKGVKNTHVDSVSNTEVEFKQVLLNCDGDEYNATVCVNEKEQISIAFAEKKRNFSIDQIGYIDSNDIDLGDLGFQIYVYKNSTDKVIIIDSFLECGHLFYVYFYTENGLKFLGKREVTMIDEANSIERIKVDRFKDELIISAGEHIDDLKFDTNKGIDIAIKAE